MKGITFATFHQHYPGSSLDDLRNITDAQVSDIYRTGYWNAVKGDDLPAGVDLSVFDMGVNAGTGRSIRSLQRAVHVGVDGVIGPLTLAAVNGSDPASIIRSLSQLQLDYYESLSTFSTFGRGWTARTIARGTAAMALIGAPAA